MSLAYHLIHSPLRDRSILIVDKDAKNRNDRTWCFWANQSTLFDDIAHRSWSQLRVVGEGFEKTVDLQAYRYKMIRGIDFYQFVARRAGGPRQREIPTGERGARLTTGMIRPLW